MNIEKNKNKNNSYDSQIVASVQEVYRLGGERFAEFCKILAKDRLSTIEKLRFQGILDGAKRCFEEEEREVFAKHY